MSAATNVQSVVVVGNRMVTKIENIKRRSVGFVNAGETWEVR
jgi:hypothetical protein